MREIIEHQHVTVGIYPIITKSQRHVSVLAVINLDFIAMEQQAILFTGKVFAPKALFSAYSEMRVVVVAFCPRKCCRRVEADPFSSKSDLTGFEHDPKNHVTECSRQRSANTGCDTRIGLHQG